jgi:sugar phosphate isomerase/epimerase
MTTTTRTGQFPIGFRQGGRWQKDVAATVEFAQAEGFAGVDLKQGQPEALQQAKAAGLTVGSVDVVAMRDLSSPDPAERDAAVQQNAEYAAAAGEHGVINYFCVVLPKDPTRSRADNFADAVDGYGKLCDALHTAGGRLAIEGWPGPDPHFPALACTPADTRAFLAELPANAGLNYDPSHLVRMGVDPLRFLREFGDRVHHVHAKDCEILDEELYEHGHTQRATFATPHICGEFSWRYVIPGHGSVRWSRTLELLGEIDYDGMVSIELEDERFMTTDDGVRDGLRASRDFLRYA